LNLAVAVLNKEILGDFLRVEQCVNVDH
jgi:hypothetical protein